jgi:hypothetical protein
MNSVKESQPCFSFNDRSDSEMGIDDASSLREQVTPDQLPVMTAPANHLVERPSEACDRIKNGKGCDPPFILDKRALVDICQLQCNNPALKPDTQAHSGVPV